MRNIITILFLFFITNLHAQFGAGIAAYTTYTRPHYGLLEGSGTLTLSQKAAVIADTLMAETARFQITATTWNGSSNAYTTYQAKELLCGINIDPYTTGSIQPFVTSARAVGFKDTVQLIANKYFLNQSVNDSVFIVANNEEQTLSYHSGPLTDYGTYELKQIYEVFHPLGIKVTDGGIITATGLKIKTWRYVNRTYGSTAATAYAKSMTSGQLAAAVDSNSNSAFEALALQIDTIATFKQYEDYVNMHYYEVLNKTTRPDTVTTISPLIVRYQKEYLEQYFGHPCITNEFGVMLNTDSNLVTSEMHNNLALGFQQCQYYSGDTGDNANSLVDPTTGAIEPTGIAFKIFVTPFSPQNPALP